jgi:hypothetical protein
MAGALTCEVSLKELFKRSTDAGIVNHLLMADIGIEFEGNTQPEEEGIRKTKALLERYL